MNDDELKKLWQEQPLREPGPSAKQLISAMQNKMTGFRSILVQRDAGELFACAFVIIIFGIFYFTVSRTPISRLGDLIVIGSSLFVAWKLVHARRATPPAPPGATIVESLRAELNAVRTQSRLLGAVLWWYLLPLTIGALVMTWGNLPLKDPSGLWVMVPADIVVTLVFIAVDIWVYRLNRRAVSKQLLPLETQLEALLRSAETGEPIDQTQVASLRPIALSTAAASEVKTAEFKVAFWQLALWSLVGFVGIWVFLAFDSSDWRAEDAPRTTAVPSIHSDATNRYSIVARKVVDLFNAGDYAGVHKLYNAGMSKAFPLKETSDFYSGLATGYGKIENIEGSTGNGYQGWPAFRLYCDHGQLTMSLALDDDDKISGIYFQPTPKAAPSWGLIVHRIFSWKHLFWFVLCVAGGLLQAWVLQKRTKRAVSISTLGIHLNQGLDLILWDEIKDVRPFRILNIRSVRLIKESGEKQLMPWTSLERHADLKAAVENFAPANHPIRNYLPLLKTKPMSGLLIANQAISPIGATASQQRAKTIALNIAEAVFAMVMLIIGYGAYTLGMFVNFIYLALLIAVPVILVIFVWRAATKKIYFGLITRPFCTESRQRWFAAIPRLAFFAACGYLLIVAIVPCQFPNQPPYFMNVLSCSLVAFQIVFALMPPRRFSIPINAMYSIGTAFMIWHFIQIATPISGEKVVLDSPMKGVSCVVQGGNDPIINHHYPLISQRYALDIFKVADNVQQFKGWKIMTDEAGFGETIYSPCSGRVAHVESDHRDNTKGQTDVEHVAGNYITIEISPEHYVLLAHLKRNSPTVKVGDEVKTGNPIAQCGNSGNTTMPHIHIQVQSTPDFDYECKTYPIAFRHVLRGNKESENTQAKRNDLLLNTEN